MADTMLVANQPTRFDDWIKRLVDILASLFGLVLLSPFFLIVAIWIKADSPGPVFFHGPRLGRGGKVFKILKFRTMDESPASYEGPRVTAQDDPRVTTVGRWLRDSKINELPQLWNVLAGEMSLVGPRPEDPEIGKTWPEDMWDEILSVRPGITSPASVLYRNEEALLKSGELMDTYLGAILPTKLRLDQLYVRHRSLLLDLDIIFWTFMVLLPRLGESSPPEESLFVGPFSRLVRRYVSWFVIDMLATFIAIGLVGAFWRTLGPLNVGWGRSIAIALGFSVIYSTVGALLGVNRVTWSRAAFADALDLILPVGVAALITFGIDVLWQPAPILPPGMILMSAVVAFFGFVLVRYRARLFQEFAARWLTLRRGALQAQERVLIVGGGDSGQFMAWLLHNGKAHGVFNIIGFVDDDLYKQDTRIRGINVLGRREDIPALVKEHDIGLVLFAIHNIPPEERAAVLKICNSTPARVFPVPDILGSLQVIASGQTLQKTEPAPETAPADLLAVDLAVDEMDDWLAELDELARDGDIAAVVRRIEAMRQVLATGQAAEEQPVVSNPRVK